MFTSLHDIDISSIATRMRSSIIEYSTTTTTTTRDVRFIASQAALQPLVVAAATVSIVSLSYHFLCGT